jgi:hypothetical protein
VIPNHFDRGRTCRFAEDNQIVMLGSCAWYDYSIAPQEIGYFGNLLSSRIFLLALDGVQQPVVARPPAHCHGLEINLGIEAIDDPQHIFRPVLIDEVDRALPGQLTRKRE